MTYIRNLRSVSKVGLLLAFSGLTAAALFWQPSPVAAFAGPADPAPASAEFYTQKVLPIFQDNCFRCHGGMNRRGGLKMDTQAGLLRGGKDGSVLTPGHPEQSLLIALIRHEGPADDPKPMPPRKKLSDADIAVLTAWVKAGALMPKDPQ